MRAEARTRKTIRIKPSVFNSMKRLSRQYGVKLYFLIESTLKAELPNLEQKFKAQRESLLQQMQKAE